MVIGLITRFFGLKKAAATSGAPKRSKFSVPETKKRKDILGTLVKDRKKLGETQRNQGVDLGKTGCNVLGKQIKISKMNFGGNGKLGETASLSLVDKLRMSNNETSRIPKAAVNFDRKEAPEVNMGDLMKSKTAINSEKGAQHSNRVTRIKDAVEDCEITQKIAKKTGSFKVQEAANKKLNSKTVRIANNIKQAIKVDNLDRAIKQKAQQSSSESANLEAMRLANLSFDQKLDMYEAGLKNFKFNVLGSDNDLINSQLMHYLVVQRPKANDVTRQFMDPTFATVIGEKEFQKAMEQTKKLQEKLVSYITGMRQKALKENKLTNVKTFDKMFVDLLGSQDMFNRALELYKPASSSANNVNKAA